MATIVICPEHQCRWNDKGMCIREQLELEDCHDVACCTELEESEEG